MKLVNRRFISIVPVVVAAMAVVVWLAWSPALLWFAKRDAAKTYANMNIQDADALNTVLSSKVKSIRPGDSKGQRVASQIDGYQFSLPSPEYKKLPGNYIDFGSDKLTVRCLGVLSLTEELTEEFAKAGAGSTPVNQYFEKTDPFQILVDSFNARPKDIQAQETFEDLERHLILLLLKAELVPIGSEKHWERIDTGKREGIIAGDTSLRGIQVTLYLPESKEFAWVLIVPKDGGRMDDVYRAIAELDMQPSSDR